MRQNVCLSIAHTVMNGNLNNLYIFTIFSAPTRMTWKMINEQNELNANKVAYSNVKQQIIQDFEKIRSEVMNKKNINNITIIHRQYNILL